MASIKIEQGLTDENLLKKIIQLEDCVAGNYIETPQIAVVGYQSSGKSSVLEALTNIPFPKDSGLCTRFATQIRFIRDPKHSIQVSVQASKNASAEHSNNCRKMFRQADTLDVGFFANAIKEATKTMGIGGDKAFSEDILKIEIFGPDSEPFSIIDIPGIFMKATAGETTEQDMEMVERMVYSYMESPRTIILAVVPANVDIATQGILSKAQKYDKTGKRTIGILTKPDLVDRGTEAKVVSIISSKKHIGQHGWYILRNLGQQETDEGADREELEKEFFSSGAWKNLPRGRIGVQNIRTKLQTLLKRHTQAEIPKIMAEIEKDLKTTREQLDELGSSRRTAEEKNSYLVGIANNFQHLVRLALDANYTEDKFFEDEDFRLATQIKNRTDTFKEVFNAYGHLYEFEKLEHGQAPNSQQLAGAHRNSATQAQVFQPGFEQMKAQQLGLDQQMPVEASTRELDDIDLLVGDILVEKKSIQLPFRDGINQWLTKSFRGRRGVSIETPLHLGSTFPAQTAKWEDICQGYISDVIVIVHDFIVNALQHVCPDEDVKERLLQVLLQSMKMQYRWAHTTCDMLLTIETNQCPSTTDSSFNALVDRAQTQRKAAFLMPKINNTREYGFIVRYDDIKNFSVSISNEDHTIQTMHDHLAAYYKIASNRVVENMYRQAVGHGLLYGTKSPLAILNSDYIFRLTPSQRDEIAAEDECIEKERIELQKRVEALEKGQQILSEPCA